MASQSAPRSGSGRRPTSPEQRGKLLVFPERRSFGPFSWRTVKIASLAVLILLLSGALLQLFLVHALREGSVSRPDTAKVPS
jgi:hypothetical protein